MTTPRPKPDPERFSYPLLRRDAPVLRRSSDELQVGVDQHPALILVDADRGVERLLSLLDGCHHLKDIYQSADSLAVPQAVVNWLLRTLSEAGLLTEGGRRDAAVVAGSGRAAGVRLVGAGTLGRTVAELLVRTRIGALYVVDNGAADPNLYPAAGVLRTQAEALASSLAHLGSAVTVAEHWSKPERVVPELTIIAADTLECDRAVTDGLLRADEAHLCIRSYGGGGVVVGPLVVPGETPCVRCLDLARRDVDQAWPGLLSQLGRIRMPAEAALASWGGAVAVTQALAYLRGGRPETCGATIEIAPADFLTRWRSWAMHPECGCGWSLTAQWGA